MQRPGNKDIQLDLFFDYANNLKLYPAFQQFFRDTEFLPQSFDTSALLSAGAT